jgi:hypothetical protein
MKTTKYRICWKSLIHEGVGGRGEPVNDFETAKKWVDKLNIQHPDIHHWYEFDIVEYEKETK